MRNGKLIRHYSGRVKMDVISRGNFSIYYDEHGDMNMSFEPLYEL